MHRKHFLLQIGLALALIAPAHAQFSSPPYGVEQAPPPSSACAANNYVSALNGSSAPTCSIPPGTTTGANPTATIGASAVNGSAGTFMRSDAAPALPPTLPAISGINLTNLNASNLASGTVPVARGGAVASSPMVIALSSNQTGVASGVETKIALQNAVLDAGAQCDIVTNNRCTPNVSGTYTVRGFLDITGTLTVGGATQCQIRKNGSTVNVAQFFNVIAGEDAAQCGAIVAMNGTTDYLELWVSASTSIGTATVVGNTILTQLQITRTGP